MPRSILSINICNILKNYKSIKKYVGEKTKVSAVVKCNCYGLGMAQIAPELCKAGCDEFYVANLTEGKALRKLLKTVKIYVFDGVERGEEKEFLKANLIPVLNNAHQLEVWAKTAKNLGKKLRCSLHIDSGMTRTGVEFHLAFSVLDNLSKDKSLEVCYILSHLACADKPQNKMNSRQLAFVQGLQKKYPHFKYSFSNSAGIFLGKEYHFDQVRPGILLYGGSPCDSRLQELPIPLLPVVNLVSRIIDLHQIKDRDIQQSIGYNSTYNLKPGMVTATVPVGYGDGYTRKLSNKGCCYINGIKVNIIGNISMDLMCLDVSHLSKNLQKIGQEVELIGNNISIEKIASLADTINYEILTSLSERYIKKYIK